MPGKPNPDNQITIYAMAHPDRPAKIRYIGKTKLNLKRRLDAHLYSRNGPKCPKNDWLRKLTAEGIRPVIWPLEICNPNYWEQRERHWIWLFKPLDLLNICEGGETGPDATGRIKSEETRRKLSVANTGKRHSPESLARMSEAQRRLKGSPEERERNRRVQLVVKNTPEWKAKASFWRNRFWNHPNYKEKAEALRTILKARKHDPNYISRLRKLGEQRRGIKLSPELKEKLSKSHEGHEVSPETRKKLRDWNISNNPTRKPIVCVDTGEKFLSIKDAERKNGINHGTLRCALSQGRKCQGKVWKYL